MICILLGDGENGKERVVPKKKKFEPTFNNCQLIRTSN